MYVYFFSASCALYVQVVLWEANLDLVFVLAYKWFCRKYNLLVVCTRIPWQAS